MLGAMPASAKYVIASEVLPVERLYVVEYR